MRASRCETGTECVCADGGKCVNVCAEQSWARGIAPDLVGETFGPSSPDTLSTSTWSVALSTSVGATCVVLMAERVRWRRGDGWDDAPKGSPTEAATDRRSFHCRLVFYPSTRPNLWPLEASSLLVRPGTVEMSYTTAQYPPPIRPTLRSAFPCPRSCCLSTPVLVVVRPRRRRVCGLCDCASPATAISCSERLFPSPISPPGHHHHNHCP